MLTSSTYALGSWDLEARVYHFFVRRKIRAVFEHLNRGDFDYVTRQYHPRAEHWFAGRHALSGKRTSRGRILEWYERLARVFPRIRFVVKKLIVDGPPWNTLVAVEWSDEVFDREGRALPNEGIFIFRLRWGKAAELHVYCDTSQIEKNLGVLASQGVDAAMAPPIMD
jgi:ketosteroid isomerase-like protein